MVAAVRPRDVSTDFRSSGGASGAIRLEGNVRWPSLTTVTSASPCLKLYGAARARTLRGSSPAAMSAPALARSLRRSIATRRGRSTSRRDMLAPFAVAHAALYAHRLLENSAWTG